MSKPKKTAAAEGRYTCFKCAASLDEAAGVGAEFGTPLHGVVFTAEGNYGSAVWDPTGQPHCNILEGTPALGIVICDTCLRANPAAVAVAFTKTRTTTTVKPWDPKGHY